MQLVITRICNLRMRPSRWLFEVQCTYSCSTMAGDGLPNARIRRVSSKSNEKAQLNV